MNHPKPFIFIPRAYTHSNTQKFHKKSSKSFLSSEIQTFTNKRTVRTPTTKDTTAETVKIFKHKSSKHSTTKDKNDRIFFIIGWLFPNLCLRFGIEEGFIPVSSFEWSFDSRLPIPPASKIFFKLLPSLISSKS